MKPNEFEAAIIELRGVIKGHTDEIQGLKERLAEAQDKIASYDETMTSVSPAIERLNEVTAAFADSLDNLTGDIIGFAVEDLAEGEVETEERRTTRMGLKERLAEIEMLVRGRNRSAPVKRNMTDADAVECLKGKAVGLDHKEAGELLGLTYAQIYSCRLEYTFKHVHKDLREAGWKNSWVKK